MPAIDGRVMFRDSGGWPPKRALGYLDENLENGRSDAPSFR
jgi:hypothetical protein